MAKRETSDVRTRLETITPAKARKWLLKNSGNRPIRDLHVRSLAAAIRCDEWKVNGETFKFDVLHNMQDGQHRAMAVIMADTSIMSFVTRGLAVDVFDTIDRNKPRSNSDLLSRHGHSNTVALAATLTWIWREKNGKMNYSGDLGRPRGQQIVSMAEEYPELPNSIRIASKVRKLLPISMGASSHYLFHQKDSDMADAFFSKLTSGEGLSKGNPVYTLREELQNNRGQAAKLRPIVIVVYTRLAWNAMRVGKKLRKLDWDSKDGIPEVE